jgi:hypothetical protein
MFNENTNHNTEFPNAPKLFFKQLIRLSLQHRSLLQFLLGRTLNKDKSHFDGANHESSLRVKWDSYLDRWPGAIF